MTYLAYIATREFGGERVEMKTLVLASELVSGVNLDVAFRAQSSFVGTTYHRRRSFLTHITLYLHLQKSKNKTELLLYLLIMGNRMIKRKLFACQALLRVAEQKCRFRERVLRRCYKNGDETQ